MAGKVLLLGGKIILYCSQERFLLGGKIVLYSAQERNLNRRILKKRKLCISVY